MKRLSIAVIAAVVAVGGVSLFTVLLTKGNMSELTFVACLSLTALAALALYLSPRLLEVDLKALKLVLQEIKQTKAEIEELYGGIEKIKREPFVMDDAKMNELGLSSGHLLIADGAMRYVAGCICRERERLAQVFINEKSPEKLAEALVDKSKDDLVFKWNGPEVPLDRPPMSVAQRKAEKAAEVAQSQPETK